MGRVLKWTFKNAIKAGLVGGAIYGTAQYGIWADAQRTKQLYEEMKANMPYQEELGITKKKLNDWKVESLGDSWNRGVIATFTWLANSPEHVKRWSGVAWTTAKDMTYNLMTINEPEEHRHEKS